MTCIFIKVYGGIVDDVSFFEEERLAVKELEAFVKDMNPQNDDAYVFGPEGMIANAKTFLDENDEFIDGADIPISEQFEEPLYIIGNPRHPLGFMVSSPDDPLAYTNPVEALSELGLMRKEFGSHLRLYRVMPVANRVAGRKDLEQYNAQCEVDDFDYGLVDEYLSPDS